MTLCDRRLHWIARCLSGMELSVIVLYINVIWGYEMNWTVAWRQMAKSDVSGVSYRGIAWTDKSGYQLSDWFVFVINVIIIIIVIITFICVVSFGGIKLGLPRSKCNTLRVFEKDFLRVRIIGGWRKFLNEELYNFCPSLCYYWRHRMNM